MKEFIWLFPLIFMFHDMEEIIGYGIWLKKNETMLAKKHPRLLQTHQPLSTEGFAFAVYEEYLLCLFFTILWYITNNNILGGLWLGLFLGCILHFFIHIGQTIIMRQYIPASLTSILCIPISIWIWYKCFHTVTLPFASMAVLIVLGILIVVINLQFARRLIGWYTQNCVMIAAKQK